MVKYQFPWILCRFIDFMLTIPVYMYNPKIRYFPQFYTFYTILFPATYFITKMRKKKTQDDHIYLRCIYTTHKCSPKERRQKHKRNS